MIRRETRSSRRFPLTALLALGLGFVATTSAIAAIAAGDAGQEGQVWNLGTQQAGRWFPTEVSVHNQSCRGAHDFTVSIAGQIADVLTITGPTELHGIKRGETKATPAKLDLRGAAAGPYEGEVVIRCLDCPPNCHLDHQTITVLLTVNVQATAPPSAPAATDNPEPGDSRPPATTTLTLPQAIAEGKVSLRVEQQSEPGGYGVRLEIVRSTPEALTVEIPVGTVLECGDGSQSPVILGTSTTTPLDGETTQVEVTGYHLTPDRETPASGSTGSMWTAHPAGDDPRYEQAKKIIETGVESSESGDFSSPPEQHDRVIQTSIWVADDPQSYTREDLQRELVVELGHGAEPPSPEEVTALSDEIWNDVDLTVKASRLAG